MDDTQPGTREKAIAYFALCTFRLGLVGLAFLAFWLSTWVSLETAGIIAGLMAMVVLGGTAYEVDRTLYAAYLSPRDEHPLSDVDGTLENIVDVDALLLIYHNEIVIT